MMVSIHYGRQGAKRNIIMPGWVLENTGPARRRADDPMILPFESKAIVFLREWIVADLINGVIFDYGRHMIRPQHALGTGGWVNTDIHIARQEYLKACSHHIKNRHTMLDGLIEVRSATTNENGGFVAPVVSLCARIPCRLIIHSKNWLGPNIIREFVSSDEGDVDGCGTTKHGEVILV